MPISIGDASRYANFARDPTAVPIGALDEHVGERLPSAPSSTRSGDAGVGGERLVIGSPDGRAEGRAKHAEWEHAGRMTPSHPTRSPALGATPQSSLRRLVCLTSRRTRGPGDP